MIIPKSNILNYIPQRAPFVMIDALEKASNKGFESSFYIEDDNVLVSNHFFSETGVLEHVAQTCAAGFGYLGKDSGKAGAIGYIGAISKVEVFGLAKIKSCLSTKVEVISSFEHIFLIQALTFCKDDLITKCQMKIVQQA